MAQEEEGELERARWRAEARVSGGPCQSGGEASQYLS